MATKKGLHFSKPSLENDALGQEFFKSPEDFAKKRGATLEDFVCPDGAHAALKRGQAFAAAAESRTLAPNSESMRELGELATKYFGEKFKVSMIPFGLQFAENAFLESMDPTGSGSITFADTDGDIDEMLE